MRVCSTTSDTHTTLRCVSVSLWELVWNVECGGQSTSIFEPDVVISTGQPYVVYSLDSARFCQRSRRNTISHEYLLVQEEARGTHMRARRDIKVTAIRFVHGLLPLHTHTVNNTGHNRSEWELEFASLN